MTTQPAVLRRAHLAYGAAIYPIDPTPDLPFPVEFDFDDAEQCAKKVLAILSRASGGFALHGCKMAVDPVRRTATIHADGAFAYYAPSDVPPLKTVDEIVAAARRTVRTKLGTVV